MWWAGGGGVVGGGGGRDGVGNGPGRKKVLTAFEWLICSEQGRCLYTLYIGMIH